jgi:hypothetical protein
MAAAKSNGDIVDESAKSTLSSLSNMETCGAHFGAPYVSQANSLERKLRELVDTAGFDVDAFWKSYRKKIDAFKYVDDASFRIAFKEGDKEKIAELRSHCTMFSRVAADDEKSIDESIRRVRPKVQRTSAKAKTNPNVCPHSADYYQERFRQTGKMSDLTCFQRAGRRELQEAQDE